MFETPLSNKSWSLSTDTTDLARPVPDVDWTEEKAAEGADAVAGMGDDRLCDAGGAKEVVGLLAEADGGAKGRTNAVKSLCRLCCCCCGSGASCCWSPPASTARSMFPIQVARLASCSIIPVGQEKENDSRLYNVRLRDTGTRDTYFGLVHETSVGCRGLLQRP